jgi:hypothetical protein
LLRKKLTLKERTNIARMKVFRYGKFYEYDEIFGDNSWSNEQIFKAASLYATCCHLGYDTNTSYSLSYIYVTREYVPETCYDSKYEDMLMKVLRVSWK